MRKKRSNQILHYYVKWYLLDKPNNREDFKKLLEKNDIDYNAIDISNITDMSGFFEGMSNFNKDISGWDISHVTNMKRMFFGMRSFNQDVSKWNVSKVEKND